MTNLDSVLKSKDAALPTKVHIVKAVVFPVAVYRCESWTIKKAKLGASVTSFSGISVTSVTSVMSVNSEKSTLSTSLLGSEHVDRCEVCMVGKAAISMMSTEPVMSVLFVISERLETSDTLEALAFSLFKREMSSTH